MRRSSRVRAAWPPPDTQPPWAELERGLFDAQEPVIAHLPAHQIATQLVELIQDEAGALEPEARRQVAQAVQRAVRPWL